MQTQIEVRQVMVAAQVPELPVNLEKLLYEPILRLLQQ
jgi:hypothetical protein